MERVCYKWSTLKKGDFTWEKIWELNMTVLYPNLCYNKVCYTWTAVYVVNIFTLMN